MIGPIETALFVAQWGDVAGIVRVQKGRLDCAYLREAAGVLGVSDLLERALAEATAEDD
jgi:hypothetical protein